VTSYHASGMSYKLQRARGEASRRYIGGVVLRVDACLDLSVCCVCVGVVAHCLS